MKTFHQVIKHLTFPYFQRCLGFLLSVKVIMSHMKVCRNAFSWLWHLFPRESEQILKKSGMKRVLLLGSGYVSGPVVEYLTRDPGTQVTVGKSHGLQQKSFKTSCKSGQSL